MLKMKRVYEGASPDDGFRILVDRLWPRGVSKEKAAIDLWAKNITPTPEIRKEFNHEAGRFDWFRQKYLEELRNNNAVAGFADVVSGRLKKGNVTLVYAAKDPRINHVVILEEYLKKLLDGQSAK